MLLILPEFAARTCTPGNRLMLAGSERDVLLMGGQRGAGTGNWGGVEGGVLYSAVEVLSFEGFPYSFKTSSLPNSI